jgi:nucleotide-binding universal stress UspA family protein
MKILLAIDDSETSGAAVAAVASRPWPERSEVRVLSVFEGFDTGVLAPGTVPFVVPPPKLAAEVQRQRQESAQQLVTRAAEKLRGSGLQVETTVGQGEARSSILEQAKDWNADLIVLGSHGRTGVKRWLIGSVAEYVVRYAPCSVEVVRHKK